LDIQLKGDWGKKSDFCLIFYFLRCNICLAIGWENLTYFVPYNTERRRITMIRFSNGHAFEYMTASGALSFDGKGWPWEQPWRWIGLLDPTLFTSVTKTLTLRPTKGNLRWYNPFRCLRLVRGGVINAVGLSNPGIDWWCKEIGSSVDSAKIPLVVSIFGEPEELAEMARILNGFNLVGLEINTSCPNTETCILHDTAKVVASCKAVKSNSSLPLILKLSVTHDVPQIVREVGNFVEAFSINSVPWAIAFPNRRSPLENLGDGGVSGKAAQPFTWDLVKQLTGLTTIPVIGPSVWDFNDLEKVRGLGAKAVSFGSIFMCHPWRPTLYVRKELKQMRV
jgi:dihydroorotate dehydrogenase (NAD+) catalytic subunit